MKRTIFKTPFKFMAVLLTLFTAGWTIAGAVTTLFFISLNFYQMDSFDYFKTDAQYVSDYYETARNIGMRYYPAYLSFMEVQAELEAAAGQTEGGDETEKAILETDYQALSIYLEREAQKYSPEQTNLRYRVFEGAAEAEISTYKGEEYGAYDIFSYELMDYRTGEHEGTVRVELFLLSSLSAEDRYKADADFLAGIFPFRAAVPLFSLISGIVFLGLLTYLICAAGHKTNEQGLDEVTDGVLHKIPFDVLTVLCAGALFAVAFVFYFGFMGFETSYLFGVSANGSMLMKMLFIAGLFFGGGAVVCGIMLFYLMDFAVKVKVRTLFSSLLVVRLISFIFRKIGQFFRDLPGIWPGIVLICAAGFLLFFIGGLDWRLLLLLTVVISALGIGLLRQAYHWDENRRQALHLLATGSLKQPIRVGGITKLQIQESADLSKIHEAVSLAAEKQLRSERMKTELITNVSHDIRTPLTSIISYVDLLKKEGPHTEAQLEYLGVLDHQAERLRKLVEDLIEASKATTGNISAELMPIGLREFLEQLRAEYAERLEKSGLELVLPEDPDAWEMTLRADGRLLWRVFDNLLGNVLKYSQSGTRVYLDIASGQEYATVTLRNVSKYPLNISEEELMERFVRGERSRHTDGSGLGLSIARSLTELMQGKFNISIDGDLFKASVSVPLERGTA